MSTELADLHREYHGTAVSSSEACAASDAYEMALDEFISFTREVSEADLDRVIPQEQRSLRVMLYHIADGLRLSEAWLGHARRGEPVPPQNIDAENALEAEAHAGATRDEVLALAEARGDGAVAVVRSLTDEEWRRTVPFGPGGGIELPVSRIATAGERHIRVHLQHIRDALQS
ncbi:MAG TPA: DinB family protein [Dehalococcoidia bacterium]|nr:DinB family protein [Dehalococcoidia bacterium]